MLFELKEYIKNLKEKEARLEKELNKVRAELREINEATAITSPPVIREDKTRSTAVRCKHCNDTGTYMDHWGGGVPCPFC